MKRLPIDVPAKSTFINTDAVVIEELNVAA
jgi:hypothetical protein